MLSWTKRLAGAGALAQRRGGMMAAVVLRGRRGMRLGTVGGLLGSSASPEMAVLSWRNCQFVVPGATRRKRVRVRSAQVVMAAEVRSFGFGKVSDTVTFAANFRGQRMMSGPPGNGAGWPLMRRVGRWLAADKSGVYCILPEHHCWVPNNDFVYNTTFENPQMSFQT